MRKVLYTSTEIRREIVRVFSTRGRRVALSAFVGEGADAYLPNPKGIRLICWPRSGGTNPDELRDLITKGVQVEFSDNLHMKVYWSRRGAVVTSANLSTNALGAGDLKECGVLVPSSDVDIDRLVRLAKPRPFAQDELRKLDRKPAPQPHARRHKRSFADWFGTPARPAWKLGWTDGGGPASRGATDLVQSEYGRPVPYNWIAAGNGNYKQGDWVLAFLVGPRSVSGLEWIYVDYVVPMVPGDPAYSHRNYRFQAFQVHTMKAYPRPPFDLDPAFKRAFKRASRSFGLDRIVAAKRMQPPIELIRAVLSECGKERRKRT